jgi:hypothetical protein
MHRLRTKITLANDGSRDSKEFYHKNKEFCIERVRIWRLNNPEKYKQYQRTAYRNKKRKELLKKKWKELKDKKLLIAQETKSK